MNAQKALKLTVSRLPGETKLDNTLRIQLLNRPDASIPPEKLLLDLVKRQARRVMNDVTECPPAQIPAHMARLDDLSDLLRLFIRHQFRETAEAVVSGAQLKYPATLADFVACLEITKNQHRAPAFINARDAAFAEINHKLDVLAGLFAQSRALETALGEEIEA